MRVIGVFVAVISVTLCLGIGACKKKGSKKSESKASGMMEAAPEKAGPSGKSDSGKPKLSAADKPKVGDSCKGLSATDGVMACDGNTKMFCSSYSKYKWKKLGDCKGTTKCVLAPTGKAVSCK